MSAAASSSSRKRPSLCLAAALLLACAHGLRAAGAATGRLPSHVLRSSDKAEEDAFLKSLLQRAEDGGDDHAAWRSTHWIQCTARLCATRTCTEDMVELNTPNVTSWNGVTKLAWAIPDLSFVQGTVGDTVMVVSRELRSDFSDTVIKAVDFSCASSQGNSFSEDSVALTMYNLPFNRFWVDNPSWKEWRVRADLSKPVWLDQLWGRPLSSLAITFGYGAADHWNPDFYDPPVNSTPPPMPDGTV